MSLIIAQISYTAYVGIKFLLYLILMAIASSLVLLFFPQNGPEDGVARIIGAFSVATLVAEVGAIWFLLTSLRAFKQKLKVAYYFLVIGIFAYALFLIPSIATIFDIGISLSLQPVLTLTPYVSGAILIFMSVRLFAKQLAIRNIWSSFWFVAVCSLVIAVAVGYIARSPFPQISQRTYEISMALVGLSTGFSMAATIVAIRIRRGLGGDYKKAVLWLVLALGMLSIAGIHELLMKSTGFVFTNMLAYFSYTFWPYLATAILFLKASLAFKAISKKRGVLPEDAGYLDVITYAAQLVSDPKAIDPILDKVRAITATGGAETLSASDKATLINVYLQLEDYLINKEPLLRFIKEELRAGLPEDFRQQLEGLRSKSADKPID
jgi:hypothetical protein